MKECSKSLTISQESLLQYLQGTKSPPHNPLCSQHGLEKHPSLPIKLLTQQAVSVIENELHKTRALPRNHSSSSYCWQIRTHDWSSASKEDKGSGINLLLYQKHLQSKIEYMKQLLREMNNRLWSSEDSEGNAEQTSCWPRLFAWKC